MLHLCYSRHAKEAQVFGTLLVSYGAVFSGCPSYWFYSDRFYVEVSVILAYCLMQILHFC